jgi:hypothetical protein
LKVRQRADDDRPADPARGAGPRDSPLAPVCGLDAEVLVEVALDEARQALEAVLHDAHVPIGPAIMHRSPQEALGRVDHPRRAKVLGHRTFPNEIVEAPHEGRADGRRDPAILEVGGRPFAIGEGCVYAGFRPALEEECPSVFHGPLDVDRRARLALGA